MKDNVQVVVSADWNLKPQTRDALAVAITPPTPIPTDMPTATGSANEPAKSLDPLTKCGKQITDLMDVRLP